MISHLSLQSFILPKSETFYFPLTEKLILFVKISADDDKQNYRLKFIRFATDIEVDFP